MLYGGGSCSGRARKVAAFWGPVLMGRCWTVAFGFSPVIRILSASVAVAEIFWVRDDVEIG